MTTSQLNDPAASRQQLVEVAPFPGYFATKTGGEITADVTKVWDGGARRPENMAGPPSTADVVVGRPYRPGIHGPILKDLARRVGSWRTTISVWDTDPELGPIGTPVVYANALLVGLTRPDLDASSSDPSSLSLAFAVEGEA